MPPKVKVRGVRRRREEAGHRPHPGGPQPHVPAPLPVVTLECAGTRPWEAHL